MITQTSVMLCIKHESCMFTFYRIEHIDLESVLFLVYMTLTSLQTRTHMLSITKQISTTATSRMCGFLFYNSSVAVCIKITYIDVMLVDVILRKSQSKFTLLSLSLSSTLCVFVYVYEHSNDFHRYFRQ